MERLCEQLRREPRKYGWAVWTGQIYGIMSWVRNQEQSHPFEGMIWYTPFLTNVILPVFFSSAILVSFYSEILKVWNHQSSFHFDRVDGLALQHPRWCQSSPRFSWSTGWATRSEDWRGMLDSNEFSGVAPKWWNACSVNYPWIYSRFYECIVHVPDLLQPWFPHKRRLSIIQEFDDSPFGLVKLGLKNP